MSEEHSPLTRGVQRAVHDTARREGPSAALSALYEAIGCDTPLRGPNGHALVPGWVRHDAADVVTLPGMHGLVVLRGSGAAADVADAPVGPAAWGEALTWLRLGLSVRLSDEALAYLGSRTTAGSPLLGEQLVKGALADAVAFHLEVRSVLDAHVPGGVPLAVSADLNALVTEADRMLLPLLGASGFTAAGPGRVAYASELIVDMYFATAQGEWESC